MLEKIIHLDQTQSYDMLVSFDPGILHDDALLNLGVCYTRLARLKDAQRCFKRLLHSRTRAGEAAQNLERVRKLQQG